jgi:hypothetical protein
MGLQRYSNKIPYLWREVICRTHPLTSKQTLQDIFLHNDECKCTLQILTIQTRHIPSLYQQTHWSPCPYIVSGRRRKKGSIAGPCEFWRRMQRQQVPLTHSPLNLVTALIWCKRILEHALTRRSGMVWTSLSVSWKMVISLAKPDLISQLWYWYQRTKDRSMDWYRWW